MKSSSPRWILLLPLAWAAPAAADVEKGKEFRWRTDLEEARRDARASGRPLLVVFR